MSAYEEKEADSVISGEFQEKLSDSARSANKLTMTLESVLRHFNHDERWQPFESPLNHQTVQIDDLSTERVHVDSTSASAYATVSEVWVASQVGPCP
jgi:hypothetical protein